MAITENGPGCLANAFAEVPGTAFKRGVVSGVLDSGLLGVRVEDLFLQCEMLVGSALCVPDAGTNVLVAILAGEAERGIVLGGIGTVHSLPSAGTMVIGATTQLTLSCGASSIDLRADGKVMIRGEDVLVRAKGTKRVRAGTVSIN
jgi:hypothetical protein